MTNRAKQWTRCTPQGHGEGAVVTAPWAEGSLPSCRLFLGTTSPAVLAFFVSPAGQAVRPACSGFRLLF